MRFEGRLGIQQRVLPSYRAPFFDRLAESCAGGLSILAGLPRPWEGIDDGAAALRTASLHRTSNVYIGGSRQYVVYQKSAVRWLQEWNPDVLVVEASMRTVSNGALVAAAHSSGTPVVGWGLGVLPWDGRPSMDRIRRRLLLKTFKRFDAMIAYSSKAKSDYMALGIPPERIRVAPNSTADLRVSHPKGARSDSLERDESFRREAALGDNPIVVSLGRLVPGKNVEFLIRAFHGLDEPAELVIVGEGTARESLEKLALQLGIRARFLGDRRAEELDRVMAAADVFVMPGLGGLALQEALCWGLPVIVAGGDGSEKDLVQHGKNGFLVPPDDESTLRETLRKLLRSRELRQEMGAASLDLVRGGFGSMTMLREFIGTLNGLFPSPHGRQGPAQVQTPKGTLSSRQSAPRAGRIAVVCKNPIEDLPPALTAVHCAAEQSGSVRLIASSVTSDNKTAYLSSGVEIAEVGSPGRPERSILARLVYWSRFRREAWGAMSREAEDTLLWISSADTALALGPRLLKKRFVLQVNELYDQRLGFRRLLAPYLRAARVVVVPEATRAAIFRHWFSLARTPTVIPNKPLLHPRERRLPLDGLQLPPEFREAMDHRIVLYQGHVDVQRSLLSVARAFQCLGPEYRLVMMGTDHGSLSALRRVCPSMVYIPPIPAPKHLRVTSHATVGVISYGFESLNSVFCAPNKIWEFSGFGVPVLAQRLPGLSPYVEGFRAGVCVDFDRPEDIAAAIHSAAEDEVTYRAGAQRLYESIDVRQLFASVLELARSER